MNTIRTMTGWVLFLVMAVAAAFFWRQSALLGRENMALRQGLKGMEVDVLAMSRDIQMLREQIDRAEAIISILPEHDESVKKTIEDPMDAEQDSVEPGALNMGEILEVFLDHGDDASPLAGPFAGFMQMFRGPQGEQLLETSVKMNLNMQFQDFFDMLAPDEAEAARDILHDYLMQTAKRSMDMFEAAEYNEAIDAAMESDRETMRKALREVIGEEGLQLYEQYEEELPAKILDASLDTQLRMFAGRLSEETRDMVRYTLVEELVEAQPDPAMPFPDVASADNILQTQRDAYGRALERLAPHLHEDEYTIVENFIRQQYQILDMAELMMPSSPSQ